MATAPSAADQEQILPLTLTARTYASFDSCIGADYGRRNGLKRVHNNAIAYVAGNSVKIHGVWPSPLIAAPLLLADTLSSLSLPSDLSTGTVRYILGRDGGGIGAFDVHPAGTHIAVAERSSTNAAPHVFIYALPSLELTHVLEDGTERAYSDVGFSGRGDKLVTVGSFPDFLLSVWDWQQQRGVLRTKAFGQEVRAPPDCGRDPSLLQFFPPPSCPATPHRSSAGLQCALLC
jgi:WD40 repeat protein